MQRFDRLFVWFTKPWMMICIASLIAGCYFSLDQPLTQWVRVHDLPHRIPGLDFFALIGHWRLVLPVLLLLGLFFRSVYRRPLWANRFFFLSLCLFLSQAVCVVLKLTLGRARPWMEGYYGFYGFSTDNAFWSFPSGHTTTFMTLAFGLSILFPKYMGRFILLGLLASTSRVLMLRHYLSDILVAAYLVLIELGLIQTVLTRLKHRYTIARHFEI